MLVIFINMKNIRNFCIIAHIDHGKSTLADRMLETTGTVDARKMKEQYLDGMELERERGITIKMAPVRMVYRYKVRSPNVEILNNAKVQNSNDQNKSLETENYKIKNSDSKFILNLIDTPGHSDFSYEVSRALAAVEGAVILVDGAQGIQAQTLAVFYEAKKMGLKVLGVINKIDLFKDRRDERILSTINDVAELLGVSQEEIVLCSGKTGEGVDNLLEKIVENFPDPISSPHSFLRNSGTKASNLFSPSRALVFDSFYDSHKGIIAGIRVFSAKEGVFRKGENFYLMFSGKSFGAKELGYFIPEMKSVDKIFEGEIGYIATGIKNPEDVRIGDTIIKTQETKENKEIEPLPGYEEPKSVVFVSLYPDDADKYEDLGNALQKLKLNDSSILIQQDRNEVLGRGYKVGFLGKLHFEIVVERLKAEFGVEVITTFPSVIYKVKSHAGEWTEITTPEELPVNATEIKEPVVNIETITPSEHLNNVLALQRPFRMKNLKIVSSGKRIMLSASMPLAELIEDFDDKLKSATSGFGSFSYKFAGYETSDIVGVEIHISKARVPGLSRFFHRSRFESEARAMVKKLKEVLPKVQYAQPIQAIYGSKIIAREDIPALKKNVTGHLYGGDRTRKMKLWEKQKKGKKKLKLLGQGKISAEVFRKMLEK